MAETVKLTKGEAEALARRYEAAREELRLATPATLHEAKLRYTALTQMMERAIRDGRNSIITGGYRYAIDAGGDLHRVPFQAPSSRRP